MILASIKPYYYYLIGERKKTIEVRKSVLKNLPQDIVFYMSKDEKSFAKIPKEFQEKYRKHFGKIGMKVVCDKVYSIKNQGNSFVVANEEQGVTNEIARQSCLYYDDMVGYLGNKDGCGWHISDLKIYDKPKELREFYYCCKEMKANEPRAGKYVSLSCYACRHNALKRTEDYPEYNNMLGYICKRNITRPPQSWQYVEEVEQ